MGFIPDDVIGQVLDRNNIVDIVSSYIPVKHVGRNFKALCPFHHEKTPSFIINSDKQIFHCFGCGMGGNVITFVMHQEHLEFPGAIRLLAQRSGITIPETHFGGDKKSGLRQQIIHISDLALKYFHSNLLSDKSNEAKAARKYLQGRDIDLDSVKNFSLGFALDKWDGLINYLRKHSVSLSLMEKAGLIIPQNKGNGFYDRFRDRIIFPIFDTRSRCVAFGARTLKDDDSVKYINSPETNIYTKGNYLYGFNWAKDDVAKQDFVIIVEGYMDFIMPFKSGVHNITASLGTALTSEQIRIIRRYTKNVVMLFDTDKAGEAATVRSFDVLIDEKMDVKVAVLTKNDDPDSFIRAHGVQKFYQQIQQAKTLFDFKLDSLISKYGNDTVEKRAKIAADILPNIKQFHNAIVRSEYIKQLSQRLSISQDALLLELKKTEQSGSTLRQFNRTSNETIRGAHKHLRTVERNILKLMLEEQEFIPLTKQEVKTDDFQNEYVRSIIEKIYEIFDQKNEVNASVLLACFDDQNISQIISGLMATNDILMGDKKRIHRDCIKRLKEDRMKARKQEIRSQMKLAVNSGDQKKLEELTLEFNNLILRRARDGEQSRAIKGVK